MDQRPHEQHGTHATDQGRTEAYDARAAAGEYVTDTRPADHIAAMSDHPDGNASHIDEAGAGQGGEGDGTAAADGTSAADAPAGNGGLFFAEVLAGLKGAEAAAREAGRQGLARTYEELRVKAVASLDIALAHAQLAHAALKWDSEDFATISLYLAQADRCFADARNAVLGRMQLNAFDAAAQAAQAPPPAPAAPDA